MLLAGTEDQITSYDDVFSIHQMFQHAGDPVIIMGGGRVGTAIAKRFEERRTIPYYREKSEKNRLFRQYCARRCHRFKHPQEGMDRKSPGGPHHNP